MIEFIRTLLDLLAEFWPVYVGGLIVLLALILLARLSTLAFYYAADGSIYGPRMLGAFLGPVLLALFFFTSLDDLARAIMFPFSCSLASAAGVSPDLVGDLETILRYLLYLVYGLMSIRLLMALMKGLQAAALGTGSPWAVAAWETAAVVLSSLAIPFLSLFVARYMGVAC